MVNYLFSFILFSGFQNHNVAASLRVIGSSRLSCITLAILHSASISHSDPRCKLLSLYPVESCIKISFKHGKLLKRKKFDVGKFCRIEFPGTFDSLEQAIQRDRVVKKTISQSKGQLHPPKYERQTLLQVAYTKHQHRSKLIKAAVAQTQKELKNCTMRAANLDGCLLSRIANTRQNGVGVVLAINDTLTPDADNDLPPLFTAAMKRVIIYFVQAVIIAGLPSGELNDSHWLTKICLIENTLLVHCKCIIIFWGERGGGDQRDGGQRVGPSGFHIITSTCKPLQRMSSKTSFGVSSQF